MKKEERIVEILNAVSDKYIDEAAPVPKKKIHYSWKTWASMVAAIVCAVGVSVYSFNHFGGRNVVMPEIDPIDATEEIVSTENTEQIASTESTEQITSIESTEPEEPQYHEDGRRMLTVGLNSADGMGFEGLMFYDISESGDANPWTEETVLETLPVFENLSYRWGPGYAIYLDEEKLLAKAEEVAEALGTEILGTKYRWVKDEYKEVSEYAKQDQNKVCQLTAMTELGEIRVEGNGHIDVFLEPAIALPQEYSFTWYETSDAEAAQVMSYLLREYYALHTFENPIAYSWGDYSFSGEQKREYYAFEGSGNLEEQILNYNFGKVEFTPDNDGKLWILRLGNVLDAAEKIGDYPIISREEAQALLTKGDYISTVPEDYLEDGVVKEEWIAKVELVYRTSQLDEVYMPYYRFYVELTETDSFNMAEGLKNFGAFYVPAVSGEYLTNFPVWNGNFN